MRPWCSRSAHRLPPAHAAKPRYRIVQNETVSARWGRSTSGSDSVRCALRLVSAPDGKRRRPPTVARGKAGRDADRVPSSPYRWRLRRQSRVRQEGRLDAVRSTIEAFRPRGCAVGAQEKTRTSTALRPQVPETCASTNSATWASYFPTFMA